MPLRLPSALVLMQNEQICNGVTGLSLVTAISTNRDVPALDESHPPPPPDEEVCRRCLRAGRLAEGVVEETATALVSTVDRAGVRVVVFSGLISKLLGSPMTYK